MRRLKGLHVDDCELTFRIVQRILKPSAYVQFAVDRNAFLDLAVKTSNDFYVLDGELPGWPLAQYADDISQLGTIPLFIYSAQPRKNLGPLLDLKPKAILHKSDGPMVLLQAILSYFYALEDFKVYGNMPKPFVLS